MDGHMDISILHQRHEGGMSWLNLSNNWIKPYYYDMVKARNHFRVTYTYIIYIYIKCLSTFYAVDGCMAASLLHQSYGPRWLNLSNKLMQSIPMWLGMPIHFIHMSGPLHIYKKVLGILYMPWMVIRMSPQPVCHHQDLGCVSHLGY